MARGARAVVVEETRSAFSRVRASPPGRPQRSAISAAADRFGNKRLLRVAVRCGAVRGGILFGCRGGAHSTKTPVFARAVRGETAVPWRWGVGTEKKGKLMRRTERRTERERMWTARFSVFFSCSCQCTERAMTTGVFALTPHRPMLPDQFGQITGVVIAPSTPFAQILSKRTLFFIDGLYPYKFFLK